MQARWMRATSSTLWRDHLDCRFALVLLQYYQRHWSLCLQVLPSIVWNISRPPHRLCNEIVHAALKSADNSFAALSFAHFFACSLRLCPQSHSPAVSEANLVIRPSCPIVTKSQIYVTWCPHQTALWVNNYGRGKHRIQTSLVHMRLSFPWFSLVAAGSIFLNSQLEFEGQASLDALAQWCQHEHNIIDVIDQNQRASASQPCGLQT